MLTPKPNSEKRRMRPGNMRRLQAGWRVTARAARSANLNACRAKFKRRESPSSIAGFASGWHSATMSREA